ncbi:MAG: hypothetical protein ACPGXZ_06640 [Saprospiraceae bacterium]
MQPSSMLFRGLKVDIAACNMNFLNGINSLQSGILLRPENKKNEVFRYASVGGNPCNRIAYELDKKKITITRYSNSTHMIEIFFKTELETCNYYKGIVNNRKIGILPFDNRGRALKQTELSRANILKLAHSNKIEADTPQGKILQKTLLNLAS